MAALQVDDYKGLNDNNPVKSPSVWVLVAADAATLDPIRQYGKDPEARPQWRTWTDDYHNLFQVLRSWTGTTN
jgi:hypothetical protein